MQIRLKPASWLQCKASEHQFVHREIRTTGLENIYRRGTWFATEDQMIPPQAEEFMAKRMGATVRKVPASHAAMVSHPKEVAELIKLAAETIMLRGEQSKQR